MSPQTAYLVGGPADLTKLAIPRFETSIRVPVHRGTLHEPGDYRADCASCACSVKVAVYELCYVNDDAFRPFAVYAYNREITE